MLRGYTQRGGRRYPQYVLGVPQRVWRVTAAHLGGTPSRSEAHSKPEVYPSEGLEGTCSKPGGYPQQAWKVPSTCFGVPAVCSVVGSKHAKL